MKNYPIYQFFKENIPNPVATLYHNHDDNLGWKRNQVISRIVMQN